ncbi:hypothetical protein GWI33_015952 [Rhynchophorus ferrugineus]|uniref:Uncharacterized protein n=1 Tax=Rhynchophorus ferrugineus TaxID=354439 RepID=A0A834I2K1_RHYFE|nr:hypothetical protein GWI33_015952 [Rhynchophorus ferrugineus]
MNSAADKDLLFYAPPKLFLYQSSGKSPSVSLFSEPIGYKAPSFSSLSKIFSYDVKENLGFALLCPAQALPIPKFRLYRRLEAKVPVYPYPLVLISGSLEPVGSRAPSFSTESEVFTMKRPVLTNLALLCPAQEPVGSRRPALSSESDISSLKRPSGVNIAVLCPAQEPVGSRAPSFSFESQIYITKRSQGTTFALLCPAQAFPKPTFKLHRSHLIRKHFRTYERVPKVSFCFALLKPYPNLILKPIGYKAPTFATESKGSIFDKKLGKGFALLCPAQGLPVPLFSCGVPCPGVQVGGTTASFNIFSVEPTNNVAPKKVGAEFGGWRVLNVRNGSTEPTNNVSPKKDLIKFEGWQVLQVRQDGIAWLTCQVTGYPVPRYL